MTRSQCGRGVWPLRGDSSGLDPLLRVSNLGEPSLCLSSLCSKSWGCALDCMFDFPWNSSAEALIWCHLQMGPWEVIRSWGGPCEEISALIKRETSLHQSLLSNLGARRTLPWEPHHTGTWPWTSASRAVRSKCMLSNHPLCCSVRAAQMG